MKLAIEARRIEKNLVTVNRRELPLGIAAKRAKRGERVEGGRTETGTIEGRVEGLGVSTVRDIHTHRERERERESIRRQRRGREVGGRRCGIYVFNLTPYDQLSSPAEKSAGRAISIAW